VRFRLHTWLALLGLACVLAALLFGIHYYRYRFVRSNADLVKLLPAGEWTTFFADFASLREAGLINLLANIQPAGEQDYRDFVSKTQIDYTRDLDTLAGATDGTQIFFVLRGRFQWDKLQDFAKAHAGVCGGDACSAPTSKEGRWANFVLIQPDVVALALSRDQAAADLLRPPGRRVQENPPAYPVWVQASPSLLKNPTSLPAVLRIFAITLQSAEAVTLSVNPGRGDAQALTVQLEATFANQASAEATRNQCEIQTKMLKLALAREQQGAGPADLGGLLANGTFHLVERRVIGDWPVTPQLLAALQ
jgi:hypothetical protein